MIRRGPFRGVGDFDVEEEEEKRGFREFPTRNQKFPSLATSLPSSGVELRRIDR